MTNERLFTWSPRDIELLKYFQDHPYFSVKYESSAERLDQREHFKDICNKASEDLSRYKLSVRHKMNDIILKYAKLNLLISRGQVTEEEVLNNPNTSVYAKGKLNFLKVFVSGFTDADIPQPIHDYYDSLFKVNAFAVQYTGVTIDELNIYMKRRKKDSKNDLDAKDLMFVNNIIRDSFKGTCDGAVTSTETLMFQAMGLHNDHVKKNARQDTTREVAVTKPKCSILPNIMTKRKMTDSDMDEVKNSVSDAIVEDTLRDNFPNYTYVSKSPEPTCFVLSHINIKKEINDSEMDIVEHSVSDAVKENTLRNDIPNDTIVAIPPKLTCSALSKISIKKEINYSDMDMVDYNVSDAIVEGNKIINTDVAIPTESACFALPNNKREINDTDTDNIEYVAQDGSLEDHSMNIIPNYTFVAQTDPTCSVLPNELIKKEFNVSSMGIIGHSVSDVQEDSLINTVPNINSGVDLNKYMKDIAEFLCKRLPNDKRRDFLNEVDMIVSQILEE